MIELTQGIWILLIIILMFLNTKWGLAVYLGYLFLVPYMQLNFGSIPLQWNTINLLVMVLFISNFKKNNPSKTLDWRPFIPFLIYFGISLIMMLLQTDTPFDYMIGKWRVQIMRYLIVPFALWNQMRVDNDSIRLYRKITIVCIIIAAGYGLFLTTMPGVNPYMFTLMAINGEEFSESYALAEGTGRIFGRLSSVFNHPMTFGFFLGLSLVYVFNNREKMNKWLFFSLLAVIVIDVMVCGVRSVIAGVAVSVAFFFLETRNFRLMIITSFIGYIGYQIILTIPELSEYISSIADINNTQGKVIGSSLDMRLEQFSGCLSEIRNCSLFGKGYDWTNFYLDTVGDHRIMLAFESLVYVVLCNSGIVGATLWGYMIIRIMKYNNLERQESAALLNVLLVFYIVYSVITGEYGYMQYYIIFYVLMLGDSLESKKITNY